jgi:hypothetical protein
MHVGAAQASTRLLERHLFLRVSTAAQVRIYVDSGKYRGLVRSCGVMGWAAVCR